MGNKVELGARGSLWIYRSLKYRLWNWLILRYHLLKRESYTCLVAQSEKRLPAMRETWVRFLGWEDPLEKEMAIHSSTLACKIPWMEEPDRLQSMGSQRVGHDWATSLSLSRYIAKINDYNDKQIKQVKDLRYFHHITWLCFCLILNNLFKSKTYERLYGFAASCERVILACKKRIRLLAQCWAKASHLSLYLEKIFKLIFHFNF